MALFRGIQEYVALDANNIGLVEDIFLYPPQGLPILYNYPATCVDKPIKIKHYIRILCWYFISEGL